MNDSEKIRSAIDTVCLRLERRPSVLIVDDEPPVLELFSRWFRQICFAVTTCKTAAEAVSIIDSGKIFDFVWLDLRMPGLSGISVLQHIKNKSLNLPVFVVTGYADDAMEKKCMELGAAAVVLKPANLEQIAALVERFKPRT